MRPPYMPTDYATVLDFDVPDADWMDVTAAGSNYEQQVDLSSGTYRHREFGKMQPWAEGFAPK